jgi:hypothetical protein
MKVEERPVDTIDPSLALVHACENAGPVVAGCRGRGWDRVGVDRKGAGGSVGSVLLGHARASSAVVHEHV